MLFQLRGFTPEGDCLPVIANDAQDEQSRLRDDEIIAQVRTFMLAGHETTAKTVSESIPYPITRHPVTLVL